MPKFEISGEVINQIHKMYQKDILSTGIRSYEYKLTQSCSTESEIIFNKLNISKRDDILLGGKQNLIFERSQEVLVLPEKCRRIPAASFKKL